MNKINKIAFLIFGLILPLASVQVMQPAHADIQSDLASNLSFEKVIGNGLKSGLPMSVILVKVFSSTPEDQRILIVTAAITLAPLDVPLIVRTAIRAGVDAEDVVTEAVALAPLEQKAIAQAAIASGADVMDVTLASAAGISRSGVTLAAGGALGSFATPASVPAFKAGTVPPIKLQRVNGGGARPPVSTPGTGDSVSRS